MSETGLVAAFCGVRRPFELREFPVPEPEPGAVVVKVQIASVCGSDMHIWRGEYDVSGGEAEPYSRSIGHEMCGTVHRLGDGVETDTGGQALHVGDRVVCVYFIPCGKCRSCTRGTTPRCPEGLRHRHPPQVWPHFNAAYGQFQYVHPGATIYKVPDEVPDELAGQANCALSHVIHGLKQTGAGTDDHLVIQGCGGLGISAIAVAREMGVRQVIAVDGVERRLDLAARFGADELIDLRRFPTPADRVRRVQELTDGWGADIVLEVAGVADAVPEGLEMLAHGGTYVEIGNINRGSTVALDPSVLVHGGKRILGTMWYEPQTLETALDFFAAHKSKYPFEQILSHKYPLTAINEAFAEQDTGRVQRSALLPWA